MPDLPEVGLRASMENAPGFAADAKKVADAEMQIVAADAKIAASSTLAAKAVAATAHEAELAAVGWRKLFQQETAIQEESARTAAAVDRIAAAMKRIEASGAPNIEEAIDALGEYATATIETIDDTEKFATIMEQAASAAEQMGAAVGDTADKTDEAAESLKNIAKMQGLQALQSLAQTAGQAGGALLGLAKDSVTTAARLEELDLVLGNLATQNNVSAAALREQVEAIRAQGIQADVAYNLVSQFVRSNLDLTQASQLARVAQDAAVISMEDSSQALAGLLHGVMTLQPEMMRYRGIIIDLESEYKLWADANGRTVSSMTGVEKQAVALQATIEQGAKIAGTYESAMESASKQLRSFPRYIADLKAEMGESLLPVYSDAIFATKDLIKQISELPEPIKATVAVTGAMTGGLLKGGSAAVAFGSQVAQVAVALKTLNIGMSAASLGLLGPAGLIAGLIALVGVGAYTYIKKQEEVLKEEAIQVAINSTSYGEYVFMLEQAGLENYVLTETLYDVVKAHQEAEGAAVAHAEAERLIQTPTEKNVEKLEELWNQAKTTSEQIYFLTTAGNAWLRAALLGEDATAAFNDELAKTAGIASTAAQMLNAAAAYEQRRQEIISKAKDHGSYFDEMKAQALDYAASLEQMAEGEKSYIEISKDIYEDAIALGGKAAAAVLKVGDAYYQIVPAIAAVRAAQAAFEDEMLRIQEQAGKEMVAAEDRANDQMLEADRQLKEQQADLWQDYQKTVAGIMQDIAQVDIDLAKDIIEAEREAAKEREKIAAQMTQDIMDLEKKLAQDIADLQRKTAERMADAQRGYQQSVQDARTDFSRDMEDMEREHEQNMLDLAIEYWESVVDLAEEYSKQAASIQEKYSQERESIEEKYRPKKKDTSPTIDERREVLMSQLEALLEQEKAYTLQGQKEVFKKKKADLEAQLNDLKSLELTELDARKQAEMDQLQAWLAEEQTKLDEAFAIAAEKEKLAFEQRKAEREIEYQRQLEDLRLALQREQQEIQIDAERRLQELKTRHEQEKQEIERRTAEALAQLDARLAEEKARLAAAAEEEKLALAAKLEAEKQNYADRQAELVKANGERKSEISRSLEEEKEEIITKAFEAAAGYIEGIKGIGPEAKAELMRMAVEDLGPGLLTWYDEFKKAMDAIKTLVDETLAYIESKQLQGGSPSKWAKKQAESIGEGWKMGMPTIRQALADTFKVVGDFTDQVQGQILSTLDAVDVVKNLVAGGKGITEPSTVPAPVLPPVGPNPPSPTTTNMRNYNLTYQGVQQSKSSIRSQFTMMEMVSGG